MTEVVVSEWAADWLADAEPDVRERIRESLAVAVTHGRPLCGNTPKRKVWESSLDVWSRSSEDAILTTPGTNPSERGCAGGSRTSTSIPSTSPDYARMADESHRLSSIPFERSENPDAAVSGHHVFVASLTDEPGRGEFATQLLNRTDEYELHTSLLNLMEIRTVLTKKKEADLAAANDAIDEIVYDAELTIPDASDVMNANELQNETLLYPMDAIIASLADGVDAELVTFDTEMLNHVGRSPEDVLEELDDRI